MPDLLGLALPAAIAAGAWLYQKAWERHERRLKEYEGVLDTLTGFTVGALDPDKIDTAMRAHRRLWLLGHDEVVRKFDQFFSTIAVGNTSTDDEKEAALGSLILAMRQEASFISALVPRWRTRLTPQDFRMRSATRL